MRHERTPGRGDGGGWVLRFTRSERLIHWANALPFLVLEVTGTLILWRRWSGTPYASGHAVCTAHRYAGVALLAGPLALVAGDRAHLSENLRALFRWTWNDVRWLLVAPARVFLPRLELPPQGKFNAGQRINLYLTCVLLAGAAASGVLMWQGRALLLAWWIHLGVYLLSLPVLCGHLFLALVHPATRHSLRAMTVGQVRRDWALEHHESWAAGRPVEPPAAPAPAAARAAAEAPAPGGDLAPAAGPALQATGGETR